MPWSNQSGGGGPWGQRGGSGGGKSPWGSGGPQGNGTPPDLEDILRRGQDRLKDFIPGGSMGGKGLIILALGVLVVWLLTGFYTVRPNEVGINMIFGSFTGTTQEGLRYNLPYPIGRVIKPRPPMEPPGMKSFSRSWLRRRISSRSGGVPLPCGPPEPQGLLPPPDPPRCPQGPPPPLWLLQGIGRLSSLTKDRPGQPIGMYDGCGCCLFRLSSLRIGD